MTIDAYEPVAAGYRTIAGLLERSDRSGASADEAVALDAALKAIAALNDSQVVAVATEDYLASLSRPPDFNAPGVASVLFRRAQALLKLSHDGALPLLWTLWDRCPSFGPATQLLAFACLDHDPDMALKALSRTTSEAFGSDPRFVVLKAQALISLGRLDDAQDILDAAQEFTRDPDLLLCRANAFGDVASKAGQLNLAFATRLLATVKTDGGDVLTLDGLRANPATPRSGPLVSAIVTTFESGDVVATSIRSLLNQTYESLEIIVVDDASTDDTAETIEALAKLGKPLTLVRQPANCGTYVARNAGIGHARGAFLLFQDSDDWAHPEKVARGVELLEKTGAVASTSRWARLDERGHFVMKNPGGYLYRNASTLIRREALDEIGLFQDVRVSADSEHYHRLLNCFGSKAVLNDPAMLTVGRARSGSLTGDGPVALSRLGVSLPRAAYNGRWIDAQIAVGEGRGEWRTLAAAPLGEGINGVSLAQAPREQPMTASGLFALDDLGRLKIFARDPRRLVDRIAKLQARLLASEAA